MTVLDGPYPTGGPDLEVDMPPGPERLSGAQAVAMHSEEAQRRELGSVRSVPVVVRRGSMTTFPAQHAARAEIARAARCKALRPRSARGRSVPGLCRALATSERYDCGESCRARCPVCELSSLARTPEMVSARRA